MTSLGKFRGALGSSHRELSNAVSFVSLRHIRSRVMTWGRLTPPSPPASRGNCRVKVRFKYSCEYVNILIYYNMISVGNFLSSDSLPFSIILRRLVRHDLPSANPCWSGASILCCTRCCITFLLTICSINLAGTGGGGLMQPPLRFFWNIFFVNR